MAKYTNLAKTIIANVGGKENINGLTHCVTRLRFNLKDETKANDEIIKNIDGVVTLIKSAGQYQVVIGNHVPEVYAEVCQIAGISAGTANDIKPDMSIKDKIFDMITGIMMPSIAIMCASGILQGLNIILSQMGLYTAESSYYILLNAIGQAFMFFFPIFLGYNTAVKIKLNPFLGMVIGAAICHPTINGVDLNLFGLTMNNTYTSTVLPVIFMVLLAKPVNDFFEKIFPDVIKTFLVPMLVLLIIVPVGYVVIGPFANSIGNGISGVLQSAMTWSPVLAGIIIGAGWQIFVMFGIHSALLIPSIMNLMSGQPDIFMALIGGVSFSQTAVVLAIWLKTKDKKLKSIALPAWISGIFGITEPAIYGVTLPRIKMFVISCIGGAAGGAVLGLLKVKCLTMAGMGVFALPGFIDPNNPGNFIGVLIAIGVALAVGFILAFIIFKDDETVSNDKVSGNTELVLSPISGKTVALEDIEDKAFANKAMGDGIAIEPTDNQVFAPFDGTVTLVFPTKHVIGLTSDKGIEMLIHVGMDTVQLEGEGFDVKVSQGDKVSAGDLLLTFDQELIAQNGFSTITPIVITNYKDLKNITKFDNQNLAVSDDLMIINL